MWRPEGLENDLRLAHVLAMEAFIKIVYWSA